MAGRRCDETTASANGARETVLRAPSSHESVESMMERIAQISRDYPLSDAARYKLNFAVHEALTNAVVHGNHTDPSKHVTVVCRGERDRMTVAIEDEGSGFDPDAVPDPTAGHNVLKESGRGILLIRACADECRYESGGRRVVIAKRFDLPHSPIAN